MTKKELFEVAKENHIEIIALSLESKQKMWNEVKEKYGIGSEYIYPFWDNLKQCESLYDKRGWSLIDTLKVDRGVFLFLEPDSIIEVFLFPDMKSVKKLIEELPGFVFYLTDRDTSFLICFNDHDYLIACGVAEFWLREKK